MNTRRQALSQYFAKGVSHGNTFYIGKASSIGNMFDSFGSV